MFYGMALNLWMVIMPWHDCSMLGEDISCHATSMARN